MKNGKLAKIGLLYAGSSVLVQMVNMVLLPIYTKSMPPEQFGQLQIVNTIQAMAAILLSLGIYSGLSRFFNDSSDVNELKNTALTFSLIWSAVIFALVYALKFPLAILILGKIEHNESFLLYAVTIAIFTSLTLIYTTYYSLFYKVGYVTVINLSRAFLFLAITYFYLHERNEGITGALKAQTIAYGAVFLASILFDYKRFRLTWSRPDLARVLKYGLGLVPGGISDWIFTLMDRYFILSMNGFRTVAVYSMGYRFGMLIDPLLLNPFKSVFTTFKYAVYKEADGKQKIRNIYLFYNFLGWYSILLVSVASDLAIQLLTTPEYHDAMYIVPLVAVSYYLSGLGEFYALGIHISNKSAFSSFILFLAAVTNFGLNFVLIPAFDMYGAALATVISYLVMNILQFYFGKRYYNLNLSFFSPYKYLIVAVPLYGVYLLLTRDEHSVLIKILVDVLVFAAFPVTAVAFKVVPYSVIQSVIQKLMKKIRRKHVAEGGLP